MLVINGKKVPVPGLESACYLDNPKYGFTNKKDFATRTGADVRSICVHTRMGIRTQPVVNCTKPRNWDFVGVNNANRDDRIASWHISIDSDGSFVCHLDLLLHKAYHCGQVNDYSVGIEMFQEADGTITNETLDACVKIIDVITRELFIQRQIPEDTVLITRFARSTPGNSKSTRLSYLRDGRSGSDYVGVFGHRNATKNRGPGDPGDHIFDRLRAAGYESYRLSDDSDKLVWTERQKKLGVEANGVPGPATVGMLIKAGYKHGLWVQRPGD